MADRGQKPWRHGVFFNGVGKVSAGGFCGAATDVAAVVFSPGTVPPFPAGGDAGAALPKMIGKPSLPLPMITI
jgi:hypothetical protein